MGNTDRAYTDYCQVLDEDKQNKEALLLSLIHISPNYPEVTTDYMFVDNAAMKMIQEPAFFDAVSYTHLDVYKRQMVNRFRDAS